MIKVCALYSWCMDYCDTRIFIIELYTVMSLCITAIQINEDLEKTK